MLPDDDDKMTDHYEASAFAFVVALIGLTISLILAWITA